MTIPPLACTMVFYWFLSFPSALSPLILTFHKYSQGISCFCRESRDSENPESHPLPLPCWEGSGVSHHKVKSNLEKERNRTFWSGVSDHHPSDGSPNPPLLYPTECCFLLNCSDEPLQVLIKSGRSVPCYPRSFLLSAFEC